MAKNIQQALQLATTNAQLSIFPTFLNQSREDKTSAIEWLQKVINKIQGAGRTDLQTVAHFRNTLRGERLRWYNALRLLDIDKLNWNTARNQFGKVYHAAQFIQFFKSYQRPNKKTAN
jgi:hypothetical protein